MAYSFTLPRLLELTEHQQVALNTVGTLVLKGGPGTGKSVVSLWRHLENHRLGKKSLLLTFTLNLEYYLKAALRSIEQRDPRYQDVQASAYVSRTKKFFHSTLSRIDESEYPEYDEIIIDEAQDVSISPYYEEIVKCTKHVSYGADNNQAIQTEGSSVEDLENFFTNVDETVTLFKNFRTSKEIISFTDAILPNVVIPKSMRDTAVNTGINVRAINLDIWGNDHREIADWIENILQFLYHKDVDGNYLRPGDKADELMPSSDNVGVLMSGAKHVKSLYDILEHRLTDCSKYVSQGVHSHLDEISNIHITTFKSSKGLEFDTVIIPYFSHLDYFNSLNNPIVSEKDFFVALTRAKQNLFLINTDGNQFINRHPVRYENYEWFDVNRLGVDEDEDY